jgi:hypothetical protein
MLPSTKAPTFWKGSGLAQTSLWKVVSLLRASLHSAILAGHTGRSSATGNLGRTVVAPSAVVLPFAGGHEMSRRKDDTWKIIGTFTVVAALLAISIIMVF